MLPNLGGGMAFIVYLDETGDHSLELVDKDFPIFALVMFICDEDIYTQKIIPSIYKLKLDYFKHEAVILHSRDIRKAQKEFGFLTNPENRNEFYSRINNIMSEVDYTLIVSVIKKQEHKEKYGISAQNPYDVAMCLCLERLLSFLEDNKQNAVQLIAESRGKREDDELKRSFFQIITQGTYFNSSDRFKKIDFKLIFVQKSMNIIGTQLADLCAYPIARHVHNPEQANPAFEIVRNKIYKKKGKITGLKIFP